MYWMGLDREGDNMLNLRPHHLLCIQKYTGHGYSEAFTKHMNNIVTKVSKGETVVLHEGCDDVCSACPNNNDGKCGSLDKVKTMDESVLRICGFSYNDMDDWNTFATIAKNKIFETDEFRNVCGSCQWFELCESTRLNN